MVGSFIKLSPLLPVHLFMPVIGQMVTVAPLPFNMLGAKIWETELTYLAITTSVCPLSLIADVRVREGN